MSPAELLDQRVGALVEPDEAQDLVAASGVVVILIQRERGGERLADGEFAVGDGKLRREGDLAEEVGGGDRAIAEKNFAGGGEDAEKSLEKGGLAAAGRTDEGVHAAGGEARGGAADEGWGAGLGVDVEVAAGKHGRAQVAGPAGRDQVICCAVKRERGPTLTWAARSRRGKRRA